MARLAAAATATGLQQANGHGAAPRPVGPALRTAPRPGSGLLGELLVANGLATAAQVEGALRRQRSSGRRIGELLVEAGIVDERDVVSVVGEQRGIPVVDLRHTKADPAALARLPEEVARRLTAIPLRVAGGATEIAVADLPGSTAAPELAAATGGPVRLVLAASNDIRRAIDSSYRALDNVAQQVKAFEAAAAAREVREPAAVERSDEPDAPVVEVVNAIVAQALRDRASDIHVEPQGDRTRVRYRVDGALHEVLSLPPAMGPVLASRIKIMANMNIVERRRAQDGQFATVIDGRALDVRVATSSTIKGETVVMRLLDKSKSLFELSELGMPEGTSTEFTRLVRSPFGMVACAGPTGSGKTTTLYAALAEINTPDRNIVTIEDPVEYVVPSINQTQINSSADVTFAGGLKAILRQDPDVILVGEMRDAETARIAVQSALTGHLVLSSIHATDAVSALLRFLDMGIESFLVASSVIGIVGQRLVRRTCTECRAPYRPSAEEMAYFRQFGGPAKNRFWKGAGCNFCSQTGYQERIGVYELLTVDEAMRELIVRRAPAPELRELARAQGMRTLQDEGVRLVREDVTTISEIVRTVYVA